MPERLTESLVRRGWLTKRRADEAHERQVLMGDALDTSLLELGYVDERQLLDAMAAAYGHATASPRQAVAPRDEGALRSFPAQWAKKHLLAPVALDPDTNALTVLSPAPADVNLIVRLGDLLDLEIRPLLAPEFRVHQRVQFLYGIDAPERFAALIAEHDVEATSLPPSEAATVTSVKPYTPPARASSGVKAETLSFGEAVSRLRDADDRDEIVRATLLYAIRDLEHASVFINHEDHLEGWLGYGPGGDHVPQLRVDLGAESAFRVVLDTRAHYLGPLPDDASHAAFLEKLGRPHPRAVLIVPIRIKNRTVALLYGENGADPIAPRIAADLMLFTTHVQMALAELLVRRKADSLSELPADQTPPPVVESHPEPVRGPPTLEMPLVSPPSPDDSLDDIEVVEVDEPTIEAPAVEGEVEDEVESPTIQTKAVSVPEVDEPEVASDEPEEPPRIEDDWAVATGAPTNGAAGAAQFAPPAPSEPLVAPPLPDPVDAITIDEAPSDDGTANIHTEDVVLESDVAAAFAPPVDLEAAQAEAWEQVDTSGLDALGAELDETIAAAQASLPDDPIRADELLDPDDGAMFVNRVDTGSLLEELDELEEQLSNVPAPTDTGEPAPTVPIHNLAQIEANSAVESAAPIPSISTEDDGWDSVDIDTSWDSDAEPAAPRPQAALRSSLVEDATVPDLSAEAWLRASSETTRARPLPPEVMERAAMPDAPEPVPLTRITVGQREVPAEIVEVNRADDHRRDDDMEPVPLTQLASDRLSVMEISEEVSLVSDEEPVPLTKLSTGSTIPATPNPFAYDEDVDLRPDHVVDPQGRLVPLAESSPPIAPVVDPTKAVVTPQAAELEKHLASLESEDESVRLDAVDHIMRAGPDALPKLGEIFPGPLMVDPFAPDAGALPPFAKCGPLLSILERHGRDAHVYVNRKLEAPDPATRFFAIYFYGAVYVPEAIPRLIQRLHDEESRVCMLGARTLFAYREHPDFAQVLDHLHGRLSASSVAARRHAAYLIGLFRDVTAIPELIEILDQKDRTMSEVAEDALAEITKQRFSGSAKKWRAWWSKNESKNRIEWLIEGLGAKEATLRRSAAEELRAVTGLDMGFDEEGPKRAREEAKQRWTRWWAEQQ
ncbi:MAG: hypothetical protein RMA76_42200 [Deltaproteobacteria bacterium]|jgi:hypothetical protein